MSSEEKTLQTPADALRVNNLMPNLEPHLSERAKLVFRNVRTEMSEECFFYGRIIQGDESTETFSDFAHRLNKLFETFNGHNDYYCFGKQIQPRVTSCIACPMSIPLAPIGRRFCSTCGVFSTSIVDESLHTCGSRFVVENPVSRIMYLAYVFVEGLDLTVLHNSMEEARLWLNTITRSFIYASREGELPVNPPEQR